MLDFGVCDRAWRGLCCGQVHDAREDWVVWERGAVWFFDADAVLDQDDGGARVYCWCDLGRDGGRAWDCFGGDDDVVEDRGLLFVGMRY